MNADSVLVLGIGNLLMGDEGAGVHAIRRLEGLGVPEGVHLLDGGTGGFHLLEAMQSASRIVLIDATMDGAPPGTIRRLAPRFSSDYPRTLTAHDIGLKDMLDAFHLLGSAPDVVLFAISVEAAELGTELSPAIAAAMDEVGRLVTKEIAATDWPGMAQGDRTQCAAPTAQ